MNDFTDFKSELGEVRRHWGWMTLFGCLLVILGIAALAYSVITTFLAVMYLGVVLLISGLLEVGTAIRNHHTHGFWLHLLGGMFDLLFAALILSRPGLGAITLTILLASFLVIEGLFRIIGASNLRVPAWGWSVFSGVINIALGVLLLLGWPVSGLWFIGTCIGVALMFRGLAWIMAGLLAHRIPADRVAEAHA